MPSLNPKRTHKKKKKAFRNRSLMLSVTNSEFPKIFILKSCYS